MRATRRWGLEVCDPIATEGLADADLAVVLAAGNQDALLELYDRYAGLAYAVAMRVLGDPGRAEDVVQEAFLKIWTNAAGFDPKKGSLRTWLITAVRNRSIDYLRGRGAHERQELELQPELAESGHRSDPWQEVSLSLERMAVREAVGSLPAEQRQAVELAYFGGYSQVEIADMIHVPLSTVKGRMRLALEKLSSYLEGRGLMSV
jgi:RNA polymerase sigma-70 factor (ECF subfamily)